MRNVYEIEPGTSKEAITTLFTFSAAGVVLTPLIVFAYVRIPNNITDSVPDDFAVDKSATGWMNQDIFYDYIKNTFHPDLVKNKIKFPVILFVDGHASHLSYKLSELCTGLKIELICLPPNATRIMQPADVSCFKPIKNSWADAVTVWRRTNIDQILTKKRFAKILKIVCDNFITKETITNGFRASGLYPFDENAIDYTKCLGKKLINQSNDTNEKSTTDEELPLQIAIDSIRFREIVGEPKWRELSEFEVGNPCSSDFSLLHSIFLELTAEGGPIKTNCDSHQTVDGVSKDAIVDFALNEVIPILATDTADFEHFQNINETFGFDESPTTFEICGINENPIINERFEINENSVRNFRTNLS